jgi:hypothetical protein
MQGIYFQIYPIKINNKCQTEVKNQNVSVNTNVERKFAVWLCGHMKKQTKLVKTQTAVREFKFTLTAGVMGVQAPAFRLYFLCGPERPTVGPERPK